MLVLAVNYSIIQIIRQEEPQAVAHPTLTIIRAAPRRIQITHTSGEWRNPKVTPTKSLDNPE